MLNNELELERKKLELIKVEAAKAEMEFRILERKSEIKKLEENIIIQEQHIEKLKKELKN